MLRLEKERTRTYLDEAEVIFVIINADQTTALINKKGREILGYAEEEIIGGNWIDMFVPEPERPQVKAVFDRILSGDVEPMKKYENFIIAKDGQKRLIAWNNAVLRDEDGKITAAVSAGVDVTAKREAEQELREAKETAEEATKVKDKFLSLVSHDLRGPAGTLNGLLGFIKHDIHAIAPEKTINTLDAAILSAKNMTDLIGDLLNVSRLKSGKLVPNSSFVDAFKLAAAAITTINQTAAAKNIGVSNEVPEETRLYCDANLIMEVLRNLLSNAIKFTRPGGKVAVFVPEKPGGSIGVRDTGVGIAAGVIENLFKYEEKTTTVGTAGERGTGLGLPLCEDIVRAHGGSISVESSQGGGTCFIVRLPEVHPGILVVDKDPAALFLVKELLGGMGVQVAGAKDGAQAKEAIAAQAPHVALVDIEMKAPDGSPLLEAFFRDPALKDTAIFATSYESDNETKRRAMALRAKDIVQKPFNEAELVSIIRRIMA
ncbi:MAG: PAS domain S-box protein [Nitrospinae bacterium]|nr:PAS domain S-box protein [Nitrospinota bacterium]